MKVNMTCLSGETRAIEAATGVSLMEAIKAAGIDDMLALCGGCCSCSTCHVYIDGAHTELLLPMAADEDDLLDGSSFRQTNSRLSCQIQLDDRMDGLHVTIAEQD